MRLIAAAALGLFLLGGCASTRHATTEAPDWWKGSVTLDNHSNFAIHHLYLTPYDNVSWGPDQLGADVLYPKEFAQLAGIDCDKYDLKLVDEDGDECVVQDVNLCDEDARVEVDDQSLLSCQGWSSAK